LIELLRLKKTDNNLYLPVDSETSGAGLEKN